MERDLTAMVDATQALTGFDAAKLQAAHDPALAMLTGWVEHYLMAPHADLGRTGAVCPFTKLSAKLDAIRIGVSPAASGDEATAFALARAAFGILDEIPVKPGMDHVRTVIIGFPHCTDEAGIAMLKRVQDRHKFYSLSRNRMIGLMHAGSDAPGLWNASFRPLRSPFPILAIRHMVEQDAPFAARHPLLAVPYLLRFPIEGSRRLWAHWRAAS